MSHGPGVIPGVVIIPDVVVVLLLGAGTATIGLTPPLLSSVAPSGIVPPLRMVDVAPGLDSGEAVPLEDKAADDDDAQPDIKPVDPIDPVVPTPPPSKVELVPIVDDMPAPPIPDSPADAEPPVLQLDPASGLKPPVDPANGLKPPGSISVAPSGSPVGLGPVDAVEPGVPSGDVAPMLGMGVVCANAPVQPAIARVAARARNRRIENLR